MTELDPKVDLKPVPEPRRIQLGMRHSHDHLGNSATKTNGRIDCDVCDLIAELGKERERAEQAEARSHDCEVLLESERRDHDETRGYRQHAEARVKELESALSTATARLAELEAEAAWRAIEWDDHWRPMPKPPAWIAEVRAAALEEAARWCDGQADLYDAYRDRDERTGYPERASEMQKHFMTMADAARKIRALKETQR